jgi:hypothetical protein
MAVQFDFDEKKTAQENIEDFLSHVESTNPALGPLLRKHLDRMLPFPDAARRSAARASFNGEIKKLLDAAHVALKAKHG